jgi:predicted Zn-dependent protease
LAVVALGLTPETARAATGDPAAILDAMKVELERSGEELRFEDYPAPYFINYQLKDERQERVMARSGALFDENASRTRRLYVEVRVGDYAFDNTEDTSGQGYDEMLLYQAPDDAPLDDDRLALRSALWLLTDQRYKEALAAYLRVKGMRVYEAKEEEKKGSFTREEPHRHKDEVATLSFDRERWSRVARDLSALVASRGVAFDSGVEIDVRQETRYQVNTEGTELLTDTIIYGIHVSATGRADDGMLLAHSIDFYARTESALPTEEELRKSAETMLDELEALRTAPVLEPYTGPALLLPEATGVFFHEAVGHRLEGERQDNDEEGRTFKGQIGKAVMPAFLSVYEDPTVQTEGSLQLNGHYLFDDQGVKTSRVPLVESGVLRNFILSRKPVDGFDRSNGHGRAQGNNRPVARMGNLVVETSKPVTRARLKEMLLEEARRQGKPFGLMVTSITGGSTNTTTYGYQAFKGAARMVYRVDAQTGEETLVRGVEIVGTPLASINKIVAGDDTVGVFNGYCGAESGYVPVSTVAPATLFSEIELQRSVRTRERGQILPPPKP